MNKLLRYGFFIFLIAGLASSCTKQKVLDKRVSLWRMDKIPYGTKFAYDNLPFIFPDADIRTSSNFPKLYSEGDSLRALIIISPKFFPEPEDMNSMIRYAAAGNQVFISALDFDDSVLNLLHLKINFRFSVTQDSGGIRLINPVSNEWAVYSYPGNMTSIYFNKIDTGHSSILGKDFNGHPNFIRIPYANHGGIFIHLDPFAFSNFFLLHNENKSYYETALSHIPSATAVVEWSDYFRYTHTEEHFSALRFILSNRALRWAFWLVLLLFLILFVVESKRKQRPIAEMPVLKNASQDFVKTVGRLYFQQKNNLNLAEKMVTAFLENIRSTYNLSTAVLDDAFTNKLAFRSGRPASEVNEIMQQIHHIRLSADLTDQELMELHMHINQFNKPE